MTVRGQGDPSHRCVTDLHGQGTADGSRIRITQVLVGPRTVGSKLGCSSDEQEGPRTISWVIAGLHRTAHWHDWADVRSIAWQERQIEMEATTHD